MTHQVYPPINTDGCPTYNDMEKRIREYFDADELKEKIQSMTNDEFINFLINISKCDIKETFTSNFDGLQRTTIRIVYRN